MSAAFHGMTAELKKSTKFVTPAYWATTMLSEGAVVLAETMCETIETNLNEMAENNSGVSYLIGKVNQQSWHMRHEWEENRRRAEGSHGNDPDFLRSNRDGDTAARDNSFATPDLSGGEHR